MFVIAGCSNIDESQELLTSPNLMLQSQLRPMDEVISMALEAKNQLTHQSFSRTQLSVVDVKTIYSASNSRTHNEPLYYIVEFGEEDGCVAVSASKEHNPILAVTEHGSLDKSSSTNPGVDLFNELAVNYLSTPIEINPPIKPEHRLFLETVNEKSSVLRIDPKVSVTWGQGAPFNKHSQDYLRARPIRPAPVGCVPLAIGMVLTHIRQPNSIICNYQNAIYSININWNEFISFNPLRIPFGVTETDDEVDLSQTSHKISLMLRQIAKYSQCEYFPSLDEDEYQHTYGVVSTSVTGLIDALDSLNVTHTPLQNFVGECVNDLAEDKVLILVAEEQLNGGAHAFVLDGVKAYSELTGWRLWDTDVTPWVLIDQDLRQSGYVYYHINWGWHGYDNGWYNHCLFKKIRGNSYIHNDYDGLESGRDFDYSVNIKSITISKQ